MNLSYRSNHQRCSLKKVFLKNFRKFSGKHLCWSLFFNKVSRLRPATLLKKRLQQRCFPVNFVKFLRIRFWKSTSRWLLVFVIHLTVSFCKEVLYIYSNLLLLEKSTKNSQFCHFFILQTHFICIKNTFFIHQYAFYKSKHKHKKIMFR